MKQVTTRGIVLSRTDYGEADRILTILTPDQGKLRVLAKGVRRIKSKLAGGIELFSTSDISFMPGRRELGTLISTRLITHYGNIVSDLDRVQLGYELIRQLNKATEDEPEADYFRLLEETFKALNDKSISLEVIRLWFYAQLLKLSGHTPNLRESAEGKPLDASASYVFDYDQVGFSQHTEGPFRANHIKLLRLLFGNLTPEGLMKVNGLERHLTAVAPLVRTMLTSYIRV